ncbi:Lon protease [Frankliniella fusca]|uniref:Lon protease n=1 Tax=Frankliniella fusca TaxID=407009 RepID=A0AAE1H5Q6_9NEOP|nr:Lon protease [Frankliniella fusca]
MSFNGVLKLYRSSSLKDNGSSNGVPIQSSANVDQSDDSDTAHDLTPLTNCLAPVAFLNNQFITSLHQQVTPEGNSTDKQLERLQGLAIRHIVSVDQEDGYFTILSPNNNSTSSLRNLSRKLAMYKSLWEHPNHMLCQSNASKTFCLEGESSTILPIRSSSHFKRSNEACTAAVTAAAVEDQLCDGFGNPNVTPENNALKNNKQGERVKKTLFQTSSRPSSETGRSQNADTFSSDDTGIELLGEEVHDMEPFPLHDPSSENIQLEETPDTGEFVHTNPELSDKNPTVPVPWQGQKRKRQSAISEHTPPKKKSINTERWKSTQAKLAYNSGIAHTSMRGKEKKAREVKSACAPTCRKKCSVKVSPEVRLSSFQKYYGLKDKSLQWHMLSKLIKSVPVKQRKVVNEDRDVPYRKNSYEYYLPDSDGSLIPVCQPMFLNTFDISVTVVKTAMLKNSPDKRGRHAKPKKRLPPELINNVKEHIKQYPTVESHYCREVSRKQYLDECLSTAKMHRMYLLERGEQPFTANLRQYRDIFNTCFNLSFFKPKKDQCALCVEWERSSPEAKEKENEQYQKHIENKKVARELKKADKLRSLNEEAKVATGKNIRVITMDLQKVLYCPKSEVGEFFYKRKLSSYNFTIFDCTTGQGYCYCWDQTTGLRGSDEVNSCVLMYFEEAVSKGVNEFFIYSDSCSGQNKNQFLYSMYYLASRKFNVNITHRYLEKGHTQMECDSVHAQIEKKTKKVDVFTPMQWYGYIRTAKVQKPAYIVKEIDQKTILSFKDAAKFLAWNKVPTSKVREISFDSTSPDIKYKVNFGDESTTAKIYLPKKGRPVNWLTFKLSPAYSKPIPLERKLVDDLKWYVKKGLIPQNHLQYYNHLFSLSVSNETAAQDVPQEINEHRELFEDDDPDNDEL